MTYRNCKRLIQIAKEKETNTKEWNESMKEKLDIFLLNNRINTTEYDELIGMIDAE